MTDIVERLNDSLSAGYSELRKEAALEIMRLRAKVEQMERQEPVGVLHVGSCYGEELEDWEFEADQRVCDRLNERHVTNPTSLKLYALPGAQPALPVAEQDQINAEAAIRSIYGARPNDEALWQTIANGMITPAHMAQAVADGTITPAYIMQPAPSVKDAVIDDLQSQFDSEGIAEHGSGDALIRLSDAIAAVEDNFAQPAPGASWVSLAERMPNPDKHDRVLIYTEGYDFGGEQVFDVKAEALNECRYSDPDEQPETCKAASHWMPHPRNVIFDYAARYAQPAPSVPTALLVAAADLVAQMEIISRVGFVDTPNDKDSCAAFCVAEGTWLELMSAVESLASALAAAPEAKQ